MPPEQDISDAHHDSEMNLEAQIQLHANLATRHTQLARYHTNTSRLIMHQSNIQANPIGDPASDAESRSLACISTSGTVVDETRTLVGKDSENAESKEGSEVATPVATVPDYQPFKKDSENKDNATTTADLQEQSQEISSFAIGLFNLMMVFIIAIDHFYNPTF